MQTYTSANTSINKAKVPAVFRKVDWRKGTLNLDLGGGKFDTATKYLEELGVANEIIDPYNRPQIENEIGEWVLASCGGADTCTLSNVLNVIDTREARLACLKYAWDHMKVGGTLYVTVYEGDKSCVGRRTKADCWQNNLPLRVYGNEVWTIFGNGEVRKGMIIAHKEVC